MPADSRAPYIALTHKPSPRITECELTFVSREPIDYALALGQHESYRRTLADAGAEVHLLEMSMQFPDCVFVEDTAVVFDEIAVIASMGAESRRGEAREMQPILARYRDTATIQLPDTLDGGDVVTAGRSVLVGLSARTNGGGVDAMRRILRPFGYSVKGVHIRDCLHLKSACTVLPDGRLLVNRSWVDERDLAGFQLVDIDGGEAFAADVALVGDVVIAAAAFPRTNAMLRDSGYDVREVDLSEFARAEGGVTCLSLIFRNRG